MVPKDNPLRKTYVRRLLELINVRNELLNVYVNIPLVCMSSFSNLDQGVLSVRSPAF